MIEILDRLGKRLIWITIAIAILVAVTGMLSGRDLYVMVETALALYGLLIAASVLGAFALALTILAMEEQKAVTVSFLTLAFGRLWHVFNMRDAGSGLIRNEIITNPYIWGALLICTGLLLSAVYLPGLSDALRTVNPGLDGWGLALGMSLTPVIIGQIGKSLEK